MLDINPSIERKGVAFCIFNIAGWEVSSSWHIISLKPAQQSRSMSCGDRRYSWPSTTTPLSGDTWWLRGYYRTAQRFPWKFHPPLPYMVHVWPWRFHFGDLVGKVKVHCCGEAEKKFNPNCQTQLQIVGPPRFPSSTFNDIPMHSPFERQPLTILGACAARSAISTPRCSCT